MCAGYAREILRDQIGDQDARKQTGYEQRQLEAKILQARVEQQADNGGDMYGEHGVEKIQVGNGLLGLLIQFADIHRLCLDWRQLMPVNE